MVASRMTIIDYLGKWETTQQQQQIQSLEGCEKHATFKIAEHLLLYRTSHISKLIETKHNWSPTNHTLCTVARVSHKVNSRFIK